MHSLSTNSEGVSKKISHARRGKKIVCFNKLREGFLENIPCKEREKNAVYLTSTE
jgi:hypothetical protein